jgi:hypothetical protein
MWFDWIGVVSALFGIDEAAALSDGYDGFCTKETI